MKIALQALLSAVIGLIAFGLCLFLPAWTFNYWQAWVFIAVFSLSTLVPSIYLAITNPAALRRRMQAGPTAESRPVQKILIGLAFLSLPAVMILSAFDSRFGWSHMPGAVSVLGDILVALGLLVAQYVVIQNSYAAANITIEAGQKLITSGLYGIVRHPLYAGTVIMMVGILLALGSYWGLFVLLIGLPVLALRILDEEKMLSEELAGYKEYTHKVHYRLVPYVW
jgi:protein-S-isoprenylcysteine O-methyltransferase Ste14